MITTSGITMQFGAKPLFENVSVKFGGGNRYGLIGANGSGKSTFMKILGRRARAVLGQRGDRRQRAHRPPAPGPVRLRGPARARRGAHGPRADVGGDGRARCDLRQRRTPTEDDYMKAADLEAKFAEYGGYDSRGTRGLAAVRSGHPRGPAPRPHERGGPGLEAARAARAGPVRGPGHPAAGRADQQPRHQLDPLARRTCSTSARAPSSSSRTTGTS